MLDNKFLAEAATLDEQLRFPSHPRLSEDFVKLWYNQQTLIVLGGADEVVLRGKAVSALLPQLLPLLTGRLPFDEIAQRIPGIRPAALNETLLLLYMNGLLEEGLVQADNLSRELVRDFGEQLKFYSRYVDFTRSNRNRYEVLGQLQASSIVFVGQGRAARGLLNEVAALGLGQAHVLPLDGERMGWQIPASPHTRVEILDAVTSASEAGGEKTWLAALTEKLQGQQLLLLVSDAPASDLTRRLNRLAVEHRVPFLRCRIGPGAVELGPAYLPGESGCYECAQLARVLDLDAPDDAPAEPPLAPDDEWLSPEEQLGISQAALLVLSLLTKLTPIAGEFVLYRLSPADFKLERQAVYQLPGCPVCSVVKDYDVNRDLLVGAQHVENWPTLYHFNSNDRKATVIPKGHQRHYAPKVLKMMEGAYKSYASGEQTDLAARTAAWPEALSQPYAGVARGDTAPTTRRRVTLDDISWLFRITAGRNLTDPQVGWETGQRFTPSGGALASQQLYLVNLAVEGLSPGLYHFNQVGGTLEQMPGEQLGERLARAVPGTEEIDGRIVAAIIQTAAFGRLEYKYAFKAYRYSLYDSGAMLQSLHTVSQVLGLELWHAAHFYDEEVSDVLNLHTVTEFPLYVAYLVEQPTVAMQDNRKE
ncbi:MAG: hypothetical protein QOC61_892 [Acidobacteriota bacterium]|nr:hypothetical protein [Acidobacteriota bacterium]